MTSGQNQEMRTEETLEKVKNSRENRFKDRGTEKGREEVVGRIQRVYARSRS